MPTSNSITNFGYATALVILCFTVYGNVLTGDFIWDDQLQVVRNTNIRTLDNIPRAFTSSLWSFMYSQSGAESNRAFDQYYRPLQTVIYILAYRLGGLSPFIYHLTNVILHCAATVMLYLLCLQLGLSPFTGFLAGALFAVHPVHTEAVSWIAGVGDLACGLFYFAALISFLRYLSSRKPLWLWVSSAGFLAALFSKEMAATFPAVAFLLIFVRPGKKQRPDFKKAVLTVSSFIPVLAIYAGFRIAAVGPGLRSMVQDQAGIFDWASLAVFVVGHYIRYVIVPFPLFIYHLLPLHFQDRVLPTLLYGAGVSACVLTAWIFRRRFPREALCLAIFGVMLTPVLYFKGMSGGVFFAERYLYMPSMAIAVLAGLLLARLTQRDAAIAGSLVVLVFSILTIQRNRDWRSEESLYQRTLQFQPETANLWTSLGEIYLRRGENARAHESFLTAMRHLADTRFAQGPYESYRVYLGLGIAEARQSMTAEAIEHLQKALEIYPDGDGAYATLGGVLISQGKEYARAIALLEKAMQLSAVNELARDYMGVALVNQGRYEQAVKYFREALQINPDFESARQHLQIALQAMNR